MKEFPVSATQLKNTLRVLLLTEDTAARAKDHAAMTPQQHLDGGTVPALNKALQQLRIAAPEAPIRRKFSMSPSGPTR